MSKFKIRHLTKYTYEGLVRDSANQIMLYPIKDDYQEVVDQSILITGNPTIDIYADYYGNRVGTFTHARPHPELIIDSRLVVETLPRPLPEDAFSQDIQWNELQGMKYRPELIDFLKQEKFDALPDAEKLIAEERSKNLTPTQSAKNICEYIYKNFTYKKGITTVETTVGEIWNLRSGVCQDFAHMLLVLLRIMNIPSRYVSGYICPKNNGLRGEGATHAWVEAFIPFHGWLGLDPTNNLIVSDTHVRLAVGKNFTDCSPVKGTYRGTANHTLDVIVTVAYEDGHTVEGEAEVKQPETHTSFSKNSFRRHQEMQMQQ